MSQSTFESKIWGTLEFVESDRRGWEKCKRCLLMHEPDECEQAPCNPDTRDDGKHGVFTIHQMPRRDDHDPYPEE